MKLYKIRNPDCLYCCKYRTCNVINKYFDCFSLNPDYVLNRDLVVIAQRLDNDLLSDFIKFQAECEVIYREN